NAGPGGLATLAGLSTPQFDSLGKAYKAIGPHRPLIRRWKAIEQSLVTARKFASTQCFVDPTTGRHYCIVVNNDLRRSRDIVLDIQASNAMDMITGKPIELKKSNGSQSMRGTISLPAGGGTIVELVK
ncbi:MAG: hypothetical protein JKX85_02710, partial [Phycisphaeraceae bacterium]|nr:hypothetical protein [Phycisphaeraceae bacterium]